MEEHNVLDFKISQKLAVTEVKLGTSAIAAMVAMIEGETTNVRSFNTSNFFVDLYQSKSGAHLIRTEHKRNGNNFETVWENYGGYRLDIDNNDAIVLSYRNSFRVILPEYKFDSGLMKSQIDPAISGMVGLQSYRFEKDDLILIDASRGIRTINLRPRFKDNGWEK